MGHVVIGRLDRRENGKEVDSSTFKKSFFFVKNLLDFWLSPLHFSQNQEKYEFPSIKNDRDVV